MQRLFTLLLLVLSACVANADNNYPVVLVHGFAGWGRDELRGFRYWGGLQGDLQEQLKAQGYTVYTASIGPFASNWDRACELYAQIKGGQVDYGENHSRTHGHSRFGRNYTGLYPSWGNVVDGKVNKVHLIGHSMGGQTIRMLAQLLNKGSQGSPVPENTTASNTLFAGGKDWVHSITTISSPNQGTLLANGVAQIGDLVKDVALGLLSIIGIGGDHFDSVFDAKLDQWGLAPKGKDESIRDYIHRVLNSKIFSPGFRDICLWSLSTQGAAEEATWVTTLPNIYYYSYANQDTYKTYDWLFRRIQLPNLFTMMPLLQPIGVFLGSRFATMHHFGTEWQKNDGTVNTVSMIKDAYGVARTFDGTSMRGQWNVMPQLNRVDHVAIIGVTAHTQIRGLYQAHARLLASLPSSTNDRNLEEEVLATSPDSVVDGIGSAVLSLNEAANSLQTENDLRQRCAEPSTGYMKRYCEVMLSHVTQRRLRVA